MLLVSLRVNRILAVQYPIIFACLAIMAASAAAQTATIDDARSDYAKGDLRSALTKVDKMLPYLARLRERATEYRGIARKLGGNEQRWDDLVLDINDTLAAAEALANDR